MITEMKFDHGFPDVKPEETFDSDFSKISLKLFQEKLKMTLIIHEQQ